MYKVFETVKKNVKKVNFFKLILKYQNNIKKLGMSIKVP